MKKPTSSASSNVGFSSSKGKASPVAAVVNLETMSAAEIASRLQAWFPDLEAEKCLLCGTYLVELLKFNKTINLISPSTIKTADAVHIADSIAASRIVEKSAVAGQPMYDFGSGNGCPGIVYAIVNPTRQVILVDRDERKMEFCKHVGATLKLANLSILQKGVEEIPPGQVVNAIARGFAPFSKALLACRKTFKKGGRFFHMKGDGWANELASTPSQFFSHWTPNLLGQYRLPEVKAEMYVVLTEKIAD